MPLEEAVTAGIPIIDWTNGSDKDPLRFGLKAHVSFDYPLGGYWQATYAIHESNYEGQIAIIYPPVYQAQIEIKEGAKKAARELCPHCTFIAQDLAANKFAPDGPVVVSSLARRARRLSPQ